MTQAGFRDFVLAQLGRAQNEYAELRGQAPASEPMQAGPVTPTPVPAPAPAQPAPVAAVPTATDPSATATTPMATSATASSSTVSGSPTQPESTTPANSPAVTNTAADSTAQKGADVQSAKQDTTSNHVGPKPALVTASASLPSAASAKPVPELPDVPEDYADDQVIHRVHPTYPKQARAKKLHGTVVLQAIVNKQGKVDSLQTVSGDPLLAQAAADAVKQWRYKPYWHNGETTEFQTRVTVEFKMP
jgi:TonB family protein